ncbi:metal dependent phosphohydrolase [Vibrio sinaloensis DSM 21326]|uniref:Metal dependent phosphohydrolase n=1 Tax=Vibrio sinaloensis DSM 21326 TaxID=945550 RepID=E8M1M1_PHOS4|nr:HD domain-containing phosphohydrolase [Vibrio sinaloensis]EGA72201.1 metal dependent phosphohydrolase [Vibrio sinaloensis DSM 21326]
MKQNIKPLPIHIHLTVVILFIVVIASGVQIFVTNKGLSTLISEANSKLFDRIELETRYKLNSHYNTAFSALSSFAHNDSNQAMTLEEREQLLPKITYLLDQFPHIVSYSFYYPTGDLFRVIHLDNKTVRQSLKVNPNTQYLLIHRKDEALYTKGLDREFLETHSVELDVARLLSDTPDWESLAANSSNKVSKPMHILGKDSLGITVFRRSDEGTVVTAGVLLEDLQSSLKDTLTTDSSLRALYNDDGDIYAMTSNQGLNEPQNPAIDDLKNEVLLKLLGDEKRQSQRVLGEFEFEGERWLGKVVTIRPLNSEHVHLLMATRTADLFDTGLLIKTQTIYASLLVLIVMLPVVYLVSKYISKPIQRVTKKALEIERFRFDETSLDDSLIREIHDLNHAQMSTQETIKQFISLTNNIARQENLNDMLRLVCRDTAHAVSADGVFLYLLNIETKSLVPKFIWWEGMDDSKLQAKDVPVSDANRFIQEIFIAKKPTIFNVNELPRIGLQWDKEDKAEIICIPLSSRSGEVIGSFGVLYKNGRAEERYEQYADYLKTLLGFTSVTIETHSMLDDQKALLDSFIQVFAGSLDKKSPYTGNHCQRVPVITQWLAQAAHQSKKEVFRHFNLTSKQWDELKMASWLHDCGKITTPEHVVDKATKLETIYDRIHEIRMRFEVLKRESEISLLKKSIPHLPDEYHEQLKQLHTEIDKDFEFIANLNLGSEFVDGEALERLHEIANKTWTRTLSKTLGISWTEKQRYEEDVEFPVSEPLLSDGLEHMIPWDFPPTQEERFTLKPTTYQANLGEVYNLSIQRGTLTDEERFIINDHIIQTIKILESLPFPKHMSNVAKIAGGHHEKIDGTGYPLGLKGEDMPTAAKIMAIADVFEALTSADRPYKKAKSLSESIRIMSFMVEDNHLDRDLFELFLTSGVYKRFADKFMCSSQIDTVDIKQYVPN